MYRYGNGHVPAGRQPLGGEGTTPSLGQDRSKVYCLFPSATDNVAKSLQLAMGTCLIQREYGYSDEEIVLQIQENPYLQWVLGMRATMTESHPSIRPPWCIFGSV